MRGRARMLCALLLVLLCLAAHFQGTCSRGGHGGGGHGGHGGGGGRGGGGGSRGGSRGRASSRTFPFIAGSGRSHQRNGAAAEPRDRGVWRFSAAAAALAAAGLIWWH